MKLKKNIAVSESGFVFDPSSGESYTLNQVGTDILDLLKQEKGFEEVKQEILEKYEVDSITFEKYYYDFINSLRQYKLIEDED